MKLQLLVAAFAICLIQTYLTDAKVIDKNPGFVPRQRSANGTADGMEQWAYVDVRPDAHMFYWLYYTYHPSGYKNVPLILWLQGGPGSSSCGFGNFEIIGPLDLNLNPRNTTWVGQASVLFVDQPVGTGYSYVDNNEAFTTDIDQITADLVITMRVFFDTFPDFKTIPFYVFGESYGGKMGAHFTRHIYDEIAQGTFESTLKGFAMGNSWISPIDSTMSWGPWLYWMSTTDDQGVNTIQIEAQKCKDAVDAGDWQMATHYWATTETAVIQVTNGVDFYNVLKFVDYGLVKNSRNLAINTRIHSDFGHLFRRYIKPGTPVQYDALDDLMNGVIREKLLIIPDDVTWGGQSDAVFTYQRGDFMKPVVDVVDDALQNTTLQVIVYQGQLDVICDTKASLDWVQQFKWANLSNYNTAARVAFEDPISSQTELFVKANNNFKYYWVLRAGHMVPTDQGNTAYRMLERILADMDR